MIRKLRRKLSRELREVWNMKVTLVPLVVGALGTPAKALEKILKTIPIEAKITESQKKHFSVLIHTSRIFGKVLEV